ncbi:hypothetical protein [Kineococcus glutinatus]|uniref:hypothetical protein n=1 Tax=Kineococcus glutinatus TaxID=1070872 RepID=UPI0031EA114F
MLVATVGVLSWQGRRQRRKQRETADELSRAEADITRAEQNTDAVIARSRQVRAVLGDLHTETDAQLPLLKALVESNDDYATYSPPQRAQVATVVGLVTTTLSIMSTPLTDEDGSVTDLSGQVVDDARQRLQDLTGDDPVPAGGTPAGGPTS